MEKEREIQQGILQQELKHTVFCRGYGEIVNGQEKDDWIYYIDMKSLTSVLFTGMNKPPIGSWSWQYESWAAVWLILALLTQNID